MQQKHSNLAASLVWFTAAISMAEILTGTWFAPLGWKQGIIAILLGHIIGGAMFFCAGLIGAKTQKSAMQTVQISFGQKGSILFSVLNAMQLIGWTAVMIYMGAEVISILNQQDAQNEFFPLFTLGLGVLIIVWLLMGFTNLGVIKSISLVTMFLLMLWLTLQIISRDFMPPMGEHQIKFGTAVEIATIMPLSWLPVVSDHTKHTKTPLKTTALSTLAYTITSCWMYSIGLGAALVSGKSEIAQILALSGVSIVGVLIVVTSTMINTALPAHSTGMSLHNIYAKLSVKWVSIITVVTGIILATILPVTQYEHFLFFIGSVFAPMIGVLIADFFVFKQNEPQKSVDVIGLGVWFIGFVIYRVLMWQEWETELGVTFPVIAFTFGLTILVRKLTKK
ncbi:putative hydroxymethylpyrimidine transporter CytX [Rodentibacter pneumotropicus]|uniref:Putative hydroxymethylpyrimidine transporter CytX n=2 Tax=Rodentibacter pneumotropicus TaxID=758 RepID=A0A4S2QEE8_9PAST|nr:putative hydroxymethylpyrimidine transporter CytX [Rodentibacter pneumotropicus]TGZ99858.1 putative hydroxymethylpyrimidine transporter CytX [Rodentibacter pneumotropicus]THA02790.1 putative hydroxymethylpyrimidine transporter CytX [Rodentibacter pneumotropicus]THA09885.1 putative hydroxymethylpyrimidine transporter CytX [Rodentibacter pneumotropicus]THA15410.1 putative hydroxymethylpyrimidine transporter CytX [Rodentibacter pneumotropicus]